jgi:ferredoxin--NADP+ reductase
MDGTNATLVERLDLTDAVAHFRIRPDDGRPDFRPGQYMALGLVDGDRLVQRPYSAASPTDRGSDVEFLIRRVERGALTPRLWASPPGARLRLGRPKGLFTIQPDDPRTHLFVATGTGIAPFISMLETLLRGRHPAHAIVVHGVSRPAELGYRHHLESWMAGRQAITYLPTVSRPAEGANVGWIGLTGRVEAVLDGVCEERSIDPRTSVAYLCGNPEMIVSAERILAARGFPAEGIKSEHYWPAAIAKGRTAA